MVTRRLLFAALLAGCLHTTDARAQTDPRQALANMIYQLSTGTPNPVLYGAELWSTMVLQTQGTLIYPQLRQLGLVQNVVVTQRAALPAGFLYAMTVQHQSGQSYWMIGIGTDFNRIEYATVATGPGSTPFTLPTAPTAAQPLPPSSTIGTPPDPTPETPARDPAPDGAQSEACRKFPNLCK